MIEIKVPSPGESITEVELGSWLVEDGAFVEMDDELVEINSDKATLTVVAEEDGQVKIVKQEGEVVNVGEVIATIDERVKGEKKKEVEDKTETPVEQESEQKDSSFAKGVPSVSAEKMMKEKALSSADIKASGRGGRITKGDVIEALEQKEVAKKNGGNGKNVKVSQPAISIVPGSRNVRREKLSFLRRKIADRLVTVKNETAMLTTFNEVDMSEIMKLRKQFKEKFKEKYGVGLGFMSFFTKAICEALKDFPGVNAQIDGEEVVYFDYCDIGIAVSSDRGLVVPVVRNAEGMSMAQIEQQIMNYALKARDGKITVDDMTGGTFTITNGGIFGSMLSTPILNPPQSAILGMHNIVERPIAMNGEVVIRPIMYLALSYDHRIIDGKEAVSFLYRVKEMLEAPSRLVLGI